MTTPIPPPGCLGIMWDGTPESVCLTCSREQECKLKFATETLLAAQTKLGAGATLKALVEETGVCEAALKLAMEFAAEKGKVIAPVPEQVPESAPVAPPEPLPPPPTIEAPKTIDVPPPSSEAVPEVAPPAADEPAPEPKKKGKAKKGKAKAKKAEKAEAAVPENPPKAGSAKSATGPVKGKGKPRARRAKARASHSGDHKWGKDTWAERFKRERDKNPEYAALTPGVKFHRLLKDKDFLIEARSGYYLLDGNKYPTLAAVTAAATSVGDNHGKNSKWNARRFIIPAMRAAGLC